MSGVGEYLKYCTVLFKLRFLALDWGRLGGGHLRGRVLTLGFYRSRRACLQAPKYFLVLQNLLPDCNRLPPGRALYLLNNSYKKKHTRKNGVTYARAIVTSYKIDIYLFIFQESKNTTSLLASTF